MRWWTISFRTLTGLFSDQDMQKIKCIPGSQKTIGKKIKKMILGVRYLRRKNPRIFGYPRGEKNPPKIGAPATKKIRWNLGYPRGNKSAKKLDYRQGSAWGGSRWKRAGRLPPGRSQSSTRSLPGRRRPAHPPHGCWAGRWVGSRPPSGYPRKKGEFE